VSRNAAPTTAAAYARAASAAVGCAAEPERERQLYRRDIPLREKTLWRMLYQTAARASEILALNIEDLDLEQRRPAVRSKGGDTEFIYWDTGTAHPLPPPISATRRSRCS
jgi:integrase